MASALGWKVTKRGWPDFFCYDPETEGVIFVEVKPPGQKLRAHQWLAMRALSRLGGKCFVSDGRSLEPFDPEASVTNYVSGDVIFDNAPA